MRTKAGKRKPKGYRKKKMQAKRKIFHQKHCYFNRKHYLCARKTGKSYTASSFRILQGLTAAKVEGCSGAI